MTPSVQATVLIPTHDHGSLLELAARSALAQTIEDLELVIVGDGVPEVTREVVAELRAGDDRVRFFDNPKGPRHGELHRHTALQHARGRTVMYLSDDDLWFPDHVETALAAMGEADLVTSAGLVSSTPGEITGLRSTDFSSPAIWSRVFAGRGTVGLSFVAHSVELYRSLPHGWRTTPMGTATDIYMWQQLLESGATSRFETRPTVLQLPSKTREHMTIDARLAEMRRWAAMIEDPLLRGELYAMACAVTGRREMDRLRTEALRREKQRRAWLASPRGRASRAMGRFERRLRGSDRSARSSRRLDR
ncbi:MAG: glycosyltransferase family A protein [Solirubrobacterales bacterium]